MAEQLGYEQAPTWTRSILGSHANLWIERGGQPTSILCREIYIQPAHSGLECSYQAATRAMRCCKVPQKRFVWSSVSDEASTGRDSAPSLLDVLRDRYAQADAVFGDGKDPHARWVATLMIILAMMGLNRAANPPIASRALCRHFANLADLAITAQPDDSLRTIAGHGLTTSTDQRVRNVWIAAAVKVLTQGGTSAGGMARDQATRLVATELNKRKVKDRGRSFSASRVKNIYLEVARSSRPERAQKEATTPMEAAIQVVRDRALRLPHEFFAQHIMPDIRATVEAIPGLIKNTDDRKRLARLLVKHAAEWASP